MQPPKQVRYKAVFAALRDYRLLLVADPTLPCVANIVAGERVAGSWWGHPQGAAIFEINTRLAEHPDVAVVKLISGKVTFVHRDLWSDLFSVVTARERWQTDGLSKAARWLLERVVALGELQTDEITAPKHLEDASIGVTARELEQRLLVYGEQFHTKSGAHAKRLEAWPHWAERAGFVPEMKGTAESKLRIETLVADLNDRFGAKASLPWNRISRRKSAGGDVVQGI